MDRGALCRLTCTYHDDSVAADDPSAAQRSGRDPPLSAPAPEIAPSRTWLCLFSCVAATLELYSDYFLSLSLNQ